MHLVCRPFTSGDRFLKEYNPAQPGCLVTEVRIPGVSGIQIQHHLVRTGACLPVIFVTAHATVSVVVRAIQSGAVHFLEKPPSDQELWEAIQEAIRVDQQRRAAKRKREHLKSQLARLSREEREVLQMLPRFKSAREIAGELGVAVRTVELRRARIMRKLELATPVELLCFAISAANGRDQALDNFARLDGYLLQTTDN
jgi:FixJ family two-component response regulator